jgi:hypothetical protein
MKPKNYVGVKFGFWTVVGFHGVQSGTNRYWTCRCACDLERPVEIGRLKLGKSKSCGCGVHKIGGEKHGLVGTLAYKSWDAMKQRCDNVKCRSYPWYGGRGITICEFIRSSPANLISLIGERQRKELTVDRKDNDGHYSCGGCPQCLKNKWKMNIRWATGKQQCRNKRNNVVVKLGDRSLTACEVAEVTGLARCTIYSRISRGERGRLLVAPVHERKKLP